MELRIGRLIDHVHLVVRDLDASKAFYRASIGALGRGLAMQEADDHFAIDELYVSQGASP